MGGYRRCIKRKNTNYQRLEEFEGIVLTLSGDQNRFIIFLRSRDFALQFLDYHAGHCKIDKRERVLD
jgi:hypothetical protein